MTGTSQADLLNGGRKPKDCSESVEIPWYVVQTRPKHELTAALLLTSRWKQYLPLYSERSRQRDRRLTLRKPLFPGYIFCQFDWDERAKILEIPSIIGILRILRRPAVISEGEIERIRAYEAAGATPAIHYKPGELVEFRVGNHYIQGVFDELNADSVLVVVEMLGKVLRVPVDAEDVRRAA